MDKNTPIKSAEIKEFPKDRIVRIDANLGEVSFQKVVEEDIEKLKHFKIMLIREYMSELIPMIFNALHFAGFEVSNLKHNKQAAMIAESLRAFMEKGKNIHHPFHDLAEVLFDYDETGKYLVLSGKIQLVNEGEKNATSNMGDSGQSIQDEQPPRES